MVKRSVGSQADRCFFTCGCLKDGDDFSKIIAIWADMHLEAINVTKQKTIKR